MLSSFVKKLRVITKEAGRTWKNDEDKRSLEEEEGFEEVEEIGRREDDLRRDRTLWNL